MAPVDDNVSGRLPRWAAADPGHQLRDPAARRDRHRDYRDRPAGRDPADAVCSKPKASTIGCMEPLTTDPRLSLHDGRFREVVVHRATRDITMVIDAGDLQVGYRRLTLRFAEAGVVGQNLYLLAEAIGASFRANHWHAKREVTEIHSIKRGDLPNGRHTLRFKLWPFHAFAFEFAEVSIADEPLEARGEARPGRFIVRG